MSLGAVLKAARDTMRTTFGLKAESCEVGMDGQPKPACGEFYIAVHPLGWNAVSGDWDLGEEYTVGVTLTMRTSFAPKDRWGIAVWLAENDGMEARLRAAVTAIHHNQTLRALADEYIDGAGAGGITTPLQLMRIDNPVLRGPDWFTAAPPETDEQIPECGVSQTVVFGKCQRTQSVPDME